MFLIKWKLCFRRKGSTVLYIWLKIIKFFTRIIESFQHISRICVVLLLIKSFTYGFEQISTNRCFPFTFLGALNLYAAQKPDPSKSNLVWIVAGLVGAILLLVIIAAFFLIRYVYFFSFFFSFLLVSLLFLTFFPSKH